MRCENTFKHIIADDVVVCSIYSSDFSSEVYEFDIFIFKTIHRICIKFYRLMWPNEKTLRVVLYDDATIQNGGRCHLGFP